MRSKVLGRVGSLAVLATLSARAEGPRVETAALSWVRAEGAESCPAEADVAHSIAQRLGHTTLVPRERAELIVEAKLARTLEGRFHVAITMLRRDDVIGRRELESEDPSCQVVAENAALVIALAIDPEARLESSPIEAAPAEPPQRAPPPGKPKPEPVKAAPRRERAPVKAEWQGDVELGAGVVTGIVPNVAPGVFARGRAFSPWLPVGLELHGAFFPEQSIETAPGKGARFTEFFGGTAVCTRLSRRSRFRAFLCAGPELGAIVGQGYGFDVTPKFRTFTVALSAHGRLGFRVWQSLVVAAGPDVVLPLKRDYFETTTASGTEPLFRMSAVGVGAALGVVWEL